MTDEAQDHLAWLMRWYAAQCDKDWEHQYGVAIDTIDNPGWTLKIDLADTDLEDRRFETVTFNPESPDGDPAQSWYHCKVADGQFQAAGGAGDLITMIGVFRAWVEN